MRQPPVILVLAGGEGRRIGGGKPQRLLAGRTLLERALGFAHARSDLVRVSVRSAERGGAVVVDEPEIEGPLGGLAAGLRFAWEERRPFLLTLPCDMPFLPDDLLPRLEQAIGTAAVAVAASDGHLHPVCALWRSEALEQVRRYAAGGGRSLKGFAARIGFAAAHWPAQPDPFFNVNSIADLAEAERRIAG